MRISQRSRLVGIAAATAVLASLVACAGGDGLHQLAGPVTSGVASGSLTPTQRVALGVATALADPTVRAWVAAEIAASPYVEWRIPLLRVLNHSSDARERLLGRGGVLSEWPVVAPILPELEFYFPIPIHRIVWDGGADVQVAVPAGDDGFWIFETDGTAKLVPSSHLPTRPTLLVAASEIAYDDLESAMRGGRRTGRGLLARPAGLEVGLVRPPWRQECWEDCGGGGGGGSGDPGDQSQYTYLTYFKIKENHDPLRGSMELEAFGSVLGSYGGCTRITDIEEDSTYYLSPSEPNNVVATAIPWSWSLGADFLLEAYEDDTGRCMVYGWGLFGEGDDFLGRVHLEYSQYNSIYGTVFGDQSQGDIDVRVTAGPTP